MGLNGIKGHCERVFKPVKKESATSWIGQRTVNGSPRIEAGILNSHNHAMYFGKIVPLSIPARIWRIIGGEKRTRQSTYTQETISGGLDFLFENLAEGETAVVVIGYELSEYCNGTASIESAMSPEEEIAIIKKLARGRNVKVLNMLDAHPELKTALANCDRIGKTGQIIPSSIFKNSILPEDIDENITALQVAHILYLAISDCPQLLKDLKDLPADELKERRESDEETLDPIDAYGLLEIAIRIVDLIRGATYQGGRERQRKYDAILIRLIEGGGKHYSQSQALKPLLAYLKGSKFGTMYVDREKNFHEKRVIQSRARTRTAVFAALGLGAIAAGTEEIKQTADQLRASAAEAEEERIIAVYEDTLDYPCTQLDNWSTKFANVILGRDIFTKIEEDLKHRYGFDEDTSRLIAIQIMQALSEKKGGEKICDIYSDYSNLTRFIDMYLAGGNLLASLSGTEVARPYQGFAPYYGLIAETAKDPNCKIPDQEDLELKAPRATRIGTYNQALEFETNYYENDLLVSRDGLLLATEPIYKHTTYKDDDGNEIGTFEIVGSRPSRNRACELAPLFVTDMRRHDADILNEDTRSRITGVLQTDISQILDTRVVGNYCFDSGIRPFTAFDGEFSFQTGWSHDSGDKQVFVARTNVEEGCSVKTGLEAACYYLRNTTEGYEPNEFKDFISDENFDPDTVEYCVTSSQAFANSSQTFDETSLPTRNF